MNDRRATSVLAIALAAATMASQLLIFSSADATDAPQAIVVELDHARLISLPKGRHQIVLGDPSIVRVTQLSDGSHAVLTGAAFGETDMAVFDGAGALVMKSTIRVKEPSDIGVTVYRGQERTSYFDCKRLCQPGMQLGDATKAFADISDQIRSIQGQATSPPPNSNPTAGIQGGL
jgi:hypothetical protein